MLDALESVGLRGDGRILQLNSYENRVFRVMLEDGSAVVAKFYRPGRWSDEQILEEHAFTAELAAHEIPVMAPIPLEAPSAGAWGLHHSARLLGTAGTLLVAEGDGPTLRMAVSPWLGGRDPVVETRAQWERLGRLLGRVHQVGGQSRFSHRLNLGPGLGQQAIDTLLAAQLIDPSLASRWESAARLAMTAVEQAFSRTGADAAIRLHGDAHRGNLLERDGLLYLVDLDDACNGPPMQDLWLFLDGPDAAGSEGRRQLDWLLAGYEDFTPFDDAQRTLIEPLRTLRLLRHAAWLAQRWQDPAFPRAFAGFGSAGYWGDHLARLQGQLEAMHPG